MIPTWRRYWRGLPVLLLLGAAGCAGLFTKTPRPLYRLTAPSDFPAGLPHRPVQLVIGTPDAPQGLDTARIAVNKPALAFDYLADGEWADRAPALVRRALIEGFENSRSLAGVGGEVFSLHADFIVDSELRDFEATYDSPAGAAQGAPTAEVTLEIKLVKIPEHTVVAQTVLTAREPAAANATPQIVAAFNAALASVIKQAVTWTLANPALSTPHR